MIANDKQQNTDRCMQFLNKALQENSERWGSGAVIDTQNISSISEVIHVERNTDLQHRGEKVRYSYFIVQDLLRFYYISEQGKELNKGFYHEKHFVCDYSAFYLNQASRLSIGTIEPSVLVRTPATKLQVVLENSPEFQFLSEQAMNTLMIRNERREEDLLTLSAKERFLKFVANNPGYADRIPQRHIASYLGIPPEALSKFKKQWLAI